MKTKATLYNSAANLLLYFITILAGIVNRWAIVRILGIEYQGINSLFSNILSMLSIAELGIGTAIVFHLYKPLEEGNVEELKSLMRFYRRCYYMIALAVLCLGTAFIPFLDFFVTENPTGYPLPFIYAWFLIDVVISYLFTFKRSILIADQKSYIITCCDILYQVAVKAGQACLLFLTGSFIGYLALMVVCRAAENIAINGIADRRYPFLREKDAEPVGGDILADIRKKVRGAFFHKIGAFIVLGTDNLLISRFLGLAAVGIYSNYYLIINSIQNICSRTLSAATASVGHMLTERNTEKNQKVFRQLLIVNGFLVTVGASGVYCVATPFVAFVFGEELTVSSFTLSVLALNLYLQGMRTVYSVFKEAAGILYEDRFVPLVESAVNLGASIALVKVFGMAGIFMGTILSTMILYSYTFPYLVAGKVLKIGKKKYWGNFLWMLGTALLAMAVSSSLCRWMNGGILLAVPELGVIAADSLAAAVSAAAVYVLVYAAWQRESRELLARIKGYVGRVRN